MMVIFTCSCTTVSPPCSAIPIFLPSSVSFCLHLPCQSRRDLFFFCLPSPIRAGLIIQGRDIIILCNILGIFSIKGLLA
ncbi:hypothetical protein BJX64DRAFT_81665 [Aspergillus heterothallicus]